MAVNIYAVAVRSIRDRGAGRIMEFMKRAADRGVSTPICRSRLHTHPLRATGDVPMPGGRGCEPRADDDALFGREVRGAKGADPEVRLHDAAVSMAAGRQ